MLFEHEIPFYLHTRLIQLSIWSVCQSINQREHKKYEKSVVLLIKPIKSRQTSRKITGHWISKSQSEL